MHRRFTYALTAGVLSSSAPAGLLRLARTRSGAVTPSQVRLVDDRAALLYVGAATAAIFAVFGYVLGRQADRLAELSETDSLTDLFNARGFYARLRSEIKRARRYNLPLSVLFLDLDGLKSVNDRDGHRAGSEVLRQVARTIRAELRSTDMAARWGGDEFTILAPNTGNDAAMVLAERIRQRIATQTQPQPLTASIGVATLKAHSEAHGEPPGDSMPLMRAADAAMYEAKRRGKNTVVLAETVALVVTEGEVALG